jgi:hypothetical protein
MTSREELLAFISSLTPVQADFIVCSLQSLIASTETAIPPYLQEVLSRV